MPIRSLPGSTESFIIAGLLLWLLAGPRIELPGLRGVRVEDLVFCALAIACLLHLRRPRRPALTSVGISAVTLTGLLAASIASARGMVDPLTAVLFAVRPLEYWIAFPASLILLRASGGRWTRRIDGLLVVVTLLQTGFAIAQYYFGLPWGFSHAAYTRAAGLTVGPYELGAISAMLVVYWIARGRWALGSLAVIALTASVSRISILGAVVGASLFMIVWCVRLVVRWRATDWRSALRPHRRSRSVAVGQLSSVIAAGLVLAFTTGVLVLPDIELPVASSTASAGDTGARNEEPAAADGPPTALPEPAGESVDPKPPSSSITQRLADTSVLGTWSAAEDLAARVPVPKTDAEYQFAAYPGLNIYVNANTAAESGLEASNLVRFFRWHLILDTFNDPADFVFGLGPSFVGPSVDGSYLRMLADGGLMGLAAWGLLLLAWLRRSPLWMTCVTITLLIGAVFIDIVYAQRPMVLFWLLLAVAVARGSTSPADQAGREATT